MTKKEDVENALVRKETMLIVGLICLAVGFIGGIAFSVYKGGPTMPLRTPGAAASTTNPGQAPPKGPTAEQARLIQDLGLKASQNPDDVNAWTQLGNIYYDTHQYGKSIQAYGESLSLAPNNPDVLTDLGVMYRRNNQPKKAIEAFDKAISANPRHESARFNKGIVLMHDLNDRQGAIKAWEALLEINPNALTPGGSQPLKDMIDRFKSSM